MQKCINVPNLKKIHNKGLINGKEKITYISTTYKSSSYTKHYILTYGKLTNTIYTTLPMKSICYMLKVQIKRKIRFFKSGPKSSNIIITTPSVGYCIGKDHSWMELWKLECISLCSNEEGISTVKM